MSAQGFFVLSESADFYYKCTDYYSPLDEYGVAWNDPALNIDWPSSDTPILSEKDKKYLPLNQIHPNKLPKYFSI